MFCMQQVEIECLSLCCLLYFFQWWRGWKTTDNSCWTFWAWEKFGFSEDVNYCHTCSFCDWFELWFVVDKHDACLLKSESNATKLNDTNAIFVPHALHHWLLGTSFALFLFIRVMDRLPGVRIAFIGDGPYRYDQCYPLFSLLLLLHFRSVH